VALIAGAIAGMPANAVSYTNILGINVDFPAGAVSFADVLVDFSPGIIFDPARGLDIPLAPFLDGSNVLGAPDMTLAQSLTCFDGTPSAEDCTFASLGSLGSLTVQFTDNLLTGDGTANADLWIFEAGPADLTFVDISADGLDWIAVGTIDGYTGVDIDAFGVGIGDAFAFVRLRDAPGGQSTGETLGADIDAIGAISTVSPVPLPASGALLLSAVLGTAGRRWVKRVRQRDDANIAGRVGPAHHD
jgi:hypothetical protein